MLGIDQLNQYKIEVPLPMLFWLRYRLLHEPCQMTSGGRNMLLTRRVLCCFELGLGASLMISPQGVTDLLGLTCATPVFPRMYGALLLGVSLLLPHLPWLNSAI